MYKQSGLLVIAALVIASMGILAPTTTVTAIVPVPDVAATAPTVTLTPSNVRDNAYVWFTLSVTAGTENVNSIIIADVTTAQDNLFTGGIFGENVRENIDNFAENLIAAAADLAYVRDNLTEAHTNLRNAGVNLKAASDWIKAAGENMYALDNAELKAAGDNLRMTDGLESAGAELDNDPIRLGTAADYLAWTGDNFVRAAQALQNAGDDDLTVQDIGENFENIATCLENYTDNAIRESVFWAAGDNNGGLENVANLLENVAYNLKAHTTAGAGALESAALALLNAAENLKETAENVREAGEMLDNVENRLRDACENFPLRVYDYDVDAEISSEHTRYFNLGFLENLENAALNMDNRSPDNGDADVNYENVIAAGENLVNAATQQNIWLGTTLASNLIGYDGELVTNSFRYWIAQAGYSLHAHSTDIENNENFSLNAAASAFDNARAKLDEAGDKIKSEVITGTTTLSPTHGWGATTTDALGTNSFRIFVYENDNGIAPDGSQTFNFLWMSPDIGATTNFTIRVWTKDPENAAVGQNDFTVSVDGEPPSVEIKVTQENVNDYLGTAVDNLVGQVYGDATITVTASEEITAFGTMRIENYKVQGENLSLTIADFASTDNKVWTYTFATADWIENAENSAGVVIEGPCATDSYGIENEERVEVVFQVDITPPVISDNGLNQLTELTAAQRIGRSDVVDADNVYHVTTVKRWQIIGTAYDNDNVNAHPDRFKWAMPTVYVNDTAMTTLRLDNDDFSLTENLVEGVNKIKVKAVDRVGLVVYMADQTTDNELDNIFVDNTVPSVEAVSILNNDNTITWTWADNSLEVGDNKLLIRLKIWDNGWGIPWSDTTLRVLLDNDTDIGNGYIDNLENNGEWDNGVASGTYNWENFYDNDNKGLEAGTYYVTVEVSDNLGHWEPGTLDNDNWVQAFTIDVTAPSAPASVVGSVTGGSSATMAVKITTTTITITGTAEAGSTVKTYKTLDNGVTWTVDTSTAATDIADSAGAWTVTVSVQEGEITGIRVTTTDTANNESTAATFGYVMADSTPPTVTISVAATSTTDTSIAVTGTVGKDLWESWSNLTLTIQVGTSAVTVPVTGAAFSTSVDLSLGANTIIATVTDGVNAPAAASVTVTRTAAVAAPSPQATEYASYAIILVIVALILAAIAIFRKR